MEICTISIAKLEQGFKQSYKFSRKIILLRMIKKILTGSKNNNNQLTTI